MISYIILAVSISIDSLGIGLTYGFKKTIIPLFSKVFLFIITFMISTTSIILGNIISKFLPCNFTNYIGFFILLLLGLYIIFKSPDPIEFDKDNSKRIDLKESIYLGIAISIDSFGMGICSSIAGYNSFMFPLFVAIFHLLFFCFGNILGKKINNIIKLPKNIWSLISGTLLILIGTSKLFIN